MQSKLEYEVPTYHNWSQVAKFYHPLQAGSIDGTDTYPHDKGIWRALFAKCKQPVPFPVPQNNRD